MIRKVSAWLVAALIGVFLIPVFILKVVPAAYQSMMNVTLSENWLIGMAVISALVWFGLCVAGAIDATKH
jgi:hypothetical protein